MTEPATTTPTHTGPTDTAPTDTAPTDTNPTDTASNGAAPAAGAAPSGAGPSDVPTVDAPTVGGRVAASEEHPSPSAPSALDASSASDTDLASPEGDGVPTLFRHSRRDVWGLGMVIHKLDDRVHMQFQDGRKRTFIADYYHLLEAVDRPLDAALGIVEGLQSMFGDADAARRRTKRRSEAITIDEQIAYLRELFEDGFRGAAYSDKHRGDGRKRALKRHRDAAVEAARERLSKKALMADPADAHAAAVEVLKTTGLVPARERRAFAAIDAGSHEDVMSTLRALIYGDSKLEKRFDAHVAALQRALGQTPSWELATVFVGLVRPRGYPVVSHEVFQRQAVFMAPGLRCSERPMGLLFSRLTAMALATSERLEEAGLAPRDLLDVRDFMWLTLKPAGRKRILEARARRRLEDAMPAPGDEGSAEVDAA